MHIQPEHNDSDEYDGKPYPLPITGVLNAILTGLSFNVTIPDLRYGHILYASPEYLKPTDARIEVTQADLYIYDTVIHLVTDMPYVIQW